jgi:hypothetical protein
MNKAIELEGAEWKEIMEIPAVRDAWGLTDETPEQFATQVYAAKFKFHSGGPGYVGDLYILQGDTLTDEPPLVLTRNSGKLVAEDFSDRYQ